MRGEYVRDFLRLEATTKRKRSLVSDRYLAGTLFDTKVRQQKMPPSLAAASALLTKAEHQHPKPRTHCEAVLVPQHSMILYLEALTVNALLHRHIITACVRCPARAHLQTRKYHGPLPRTYGATTLRS